MEKKNTPFRLLLAVSALIYLTAGPTLAAGKVKAEGILTSVEDDGIVLIDENGFEVERSAEIFDEEGKPVLLRSLRTPTKVYFEYEYTKKGPVIKVIKEIPSEIPQ